jgi:hypothetical protein
MRDSWTPGNKSITSKRLLTIPGIEVGTATGGLYNAARRNIRDSLLPGGLRKTADAASIPWASSLKSNSHFVSAST